MIALALGFVCWIATMIVVESELTRPLREWLLRHTMLSPHAMALALMKTLTAQQIYAGKRRHRRDWRNVAWRKAHYLASCHLCAGTWIALVLTALVHDHTFGSGVVAWVLSALLVKAIAHALLIIQRYAEDA